MISRSAGCRSSSKAPNELELARGGPFEYECATLESGLRRPAIWLGIVSVLAFAGGFFSNTPEVSVMVPLSSLGLFGFLAARHLAYRDLIQLDTQTRTLRRTVRYSGRVVEAQEPWLSADDIVELHLHRPIPNQGVHAFVERKVFALLGDGRRKLLYRETVNPALQKEDAAASVAERIAAFADCTVREFDGPAGPGDAEIREALAQRQIAREEAARSPAEPLPPMPAIDPAAEGGRDAEDRPETRDRTGVSS